MTRSGHAVILRDADIGRARPVHVRIEAGLVAEVGPNVGGTDEWIDCAGAAVVPGLHDHHVHLLATAAALDSVACGPPDVRSSTEFASALRGAVPRSGWIRGVGYDDRCTGDLDRAVLDGVRADVPIRIQHRGGSLWVLNSAGLDALRIRDAELDGVERDAAGRPTGRLWRLDGWLRSRIGTGPGPDLAALGARLASYGITGVTDATPNLTEDTVRKLRGGALAQRITMLGDPAGDAAWKIVVSDHALPDLDALHAEIATVRPRAVALHCVTRVALVLALAALREVGARRGDRIEHAAVCPPELAVQLAELAITVVTQPSLLALRGDDYVERVDAADLPALWPFASLLAAGVQVGSSSDAPYGDLDPWRTIASAVQRRTPSGLVVGEAERVPADVALARFLTAPGDPGGAPRRIARGADADLIVLDRPLADVLRRPQDVCVRHTLIGGRIVHSLEPVSV